MPIDARAARNTFLATMATVVQRGGVSGAQAMEEVAATTAKEIASGTVGIESAELLAALPDIWRSDPKGSTSRDQMNAFLKVAGPVLGVDQGNVTPLATRGVTMGHDVDAAIAINKARVAGSAPSATLDVPIDLSTASPLEVRDAVSAALQDPLFLDALGGQRLKHMVRDLGQELASAFAYAAPVDPNAPVVLAGGVPVSGPDIHRAAQQRRHGIFRALPMQTNVRALAMAVAEVAAVRSGLDEFEFRSAVEGRDVGFESGRMPPPEAMPLHVAISDDGKFGIGIGIDPELARKFHDNDSLDDDALTSAVGNALRNEDVELFKFLDAEMPVGFFLDARMQKTKTVKDRLAAADA